MKRSIVIFRGSPCLGSFSADSKQKVNCLRDSLILTSVGSAAPAQGARAAVKVVATAATAAAVAGVVRVHGRRVVKVLRELADDTLTCQASECCVLKA